MFDTYEIKMINDEEILYIYLDLNCEFSIKDFNLKREKINSIIKRFIIENKIDFKGNLVTLIIGSTIVFNTVLNNYDIKRSQYVINDNIKYVSKEVVNSNNTVNNLNKKIQEEQIKEQELVKQLEIKTSNSKNNVNVTNKKKSSNKVVNNKTSVQNNLKSNNVNKSKEKKVDEKIKENTENKQDIDNNIYISLNKNGHVINIELEEYLIGVVGAEMPASFHMEALKSQAIISRTYALKAKSKGKVLSSNESNQSYKSNDELKKLWGNNYNTYYNKIVNAVKATKGMYLVYNGNYIEAVFHSTSNGKTESSISVWGNSYPYLVSVDSIYDNSNPSFIKNKEFTYSELQEKLGFEINNETEINIINKTSGNRVNKVVIDNHEYTGVKLRNILGLRSADFEIEKKENKVIFTTKGYGHGVGLSQYGANGYAKNGYSYKDILNHYYKGVSIKKII